jgi:hypothetical protein
MLQPKEFTVSAETASELHCCRLDNKVRLDVSSSTFPSTASERESQPDVQLAVAERLLGAIALFVNEVMLNERDGAATWIRVLHLTLDRTPQLAPTSPRTHLVRFEERLEQGLIKRLGLRTRDNETVFNRLGTDLYDWIQAHREVLKDQYRLVEKSPGEVEVEVKGHGYPTAARILGESRPRDKRVEPLIGRGK